MAVQFQHLGREWQATPTGTGHGVGFGHIPAVNRWGVIFRPIDGTDEYRGQISAADPSAVSADELRAALDEPLVLAAIERSRYTWRPAEAISEETGIPLEQVRRILETTSADVIVAPELNKQGYTLYSTRDHYQKTTSFLKRYFDTLESS
jgi:hypothetical protein